jgi:hypothetical protein
MIQSSQNLRALKPSTCPGSLISFQTLLFRFDHKIHAMTANRPAVALSSFEQIEKIASLALSHYCNRGKIALSKPA